MKPNRRYERMDDAQFRRWTELQRDIVDVVKILRSQGYKDGEIERMMEKYVREGEEK